MASLEDRLDMDVEAWRPNPGDKILGKVVLVSTREGDYGEYPYLEIDLGDEVVAVHAFHSVLKNELARYQPKAGDTLGIKYKGKVDTKRNDVKTGKPVQFEGYKVVHESAKEEHVAPNWDDMGAEAQNELAMQGQPSLDPHEDEEPF